VPAYAPPADEFAQTRPPDDLFDDDFVPVNEAPVQQHDPPVEATAEEAARALLGHQNPHHAPPPRQQQHAPPPSAQMSIHAPGNKPSMHAAPPDAPRGPRRGRGRGGVPAANGHSGPRVRATPPPNASTSDADAKSGSNDKRTSGDGTASKPESVSPVPADGKPSDVATAVTTGPPAAGESAPAGAPSGPAVPTVQAVRGDRSGTGGVRKAKLTEDELTAKMEEMKVKNAALNAAHARSRADEESFRAREELASKKRAEERAAQGRIDGERKVAQERKLKAMGVREWDRDKDERDFAGAQPERRGLRGDGDGGLSVRGAGRGRGRGGRGRGGGFAAAAGRTEGEGPVARLPAGPAAAALPKPADFPELPAAQVPAKDAKPPAKLEFPLKTAAAKKPEGEQAATEAGAKSPDLISPLKPGASWADQ
jgi:hypothetical protein